MDERATAQAIKTRLASRRWRINNLYRITDERGIEVPFIMNPEQERFYRDMWYFNTILKARQLGFSTFIQIFGLDMCLFNSNVEFGIIAQSIDDAKAIFRNKIKFAYDKLPEWLKAERTASIDSANEIRFNNNSGVRVGTSLRGGTLQILHVSEYGKIAAKFPEKAKEIKTGAFNTVHAGQFIFVESTAEGAGGEFYNLCQRSEKLQQQGKKLGPLDPKFHFYPWWQKKSYRLANTGNIVDLRLKRYFDKLESEWIHLDDEQKAWYAAKEAQMSDDDGTDPTALMRREFPSTKKEPFEVAVRGAYFARQMARVRKEGRICRIPIETSLPINTFWDLGRNDNNAIWMHQAVGKEDRFIGFYQNSGESLSHYAQYLKNWLPSDCTWGIHHLPHDASVTDLSRTDNLTREQVLNQLGVKPTKLVPKIDKLGTGIELTRQAFASCWFDEERCAEGIKCLDNYRKAWNDTMAVWHDYPMKSEFNHGADAFRQFAQGWDDNPGWAGSDDVEDDWVL